MPQIQISLISYCGSQPTGAMVLYCPGSAPMHSRSEVETYVTSQSRMLLLFLFQCERVTDFGTGFRAGILWSWISTSMFIAWIHLANRFPVDGLASKHIHGRCKVGWAWCGTGRRPKADKSLTPPLIQELLWERVREVESMRNSKVTS